MKHAFFDLAGQVWRRSPRTLRRGVLYLTQRVYTVGVVGLVPNHDGAVLVLRHRFRVPHAWGLPGGYLENGETPNQAFARELLEETGVPVEVCAGVLEHELNHATNTISYVVLAKPTDLKPPRLGREALDFRFCTPENLPDEMQPTHAAFLRRYWGRAREPVDNLLVLS